MTWPAQNADCGTGAGGFKQGNTCALGGDGSIDESFSDNPKEFLPSNSEWKNELKDMWQGRNTPFEECRIGDTCGDATNRLKEILDSKGVITERVGGEYKDSSGEKRGHYWLEHTYSGLIIDPTEAQFRDDIKIGDISLYEGRSQEAKRYRAVRERPIDNMQHVSLTLNTSGLRYVEVNGRQFAIAPATILQPKVLNGSKGALFYPQEEIAKTYEAWNGRPIVVKHPQRTGQNVSANHPDIFAKQEIGRVFESKLNKDGANEVEAWFDVELTKRIDNRIWNALVNGEKIELSTGLYTDNDEAPANSQHNNTPYTHIARNYRPDHLAILIDDIGACSIGDGCGVFNQRPTGLTCNSKDIDMKNLVIDWLTANCSCYKGADSKAKLEKLTDNELKEVLLENAETAIENDADMQFMSWLSNADKDIRGAFVGMMKKKLKGAAGNSDAKKKVEDDEEEEEMMKKKKAASMMNKDKDDKKDSKKEPAANQLTEEEYLNTLPSTLREAVVNAKKISDGEKQRLVSQLTNHITDNSKKQCVINSLMQKTLDDLRERVELMPVANNGSQQQQPLNDVAPPFGSPVANYFGAAGLYNDNSIVDNKALQEEKVELPVYNWKEISETNAKRKND